MLFVCKDENSMKKIIFELIKCCHFAENEILKIENNIIKFKNESFIEVKIQNDNPTSEFIRGKRSKLPLIIDNDFCISKEVVDEVIKPYMKEENK
jgi:hypothetical protein